MEDKILKMCKEILEFDGVDKHCGSILCTECPFNDYSCTMLSSEENKRIAKKYIDDNTKKESEVVGKVRRTLRVLLYDWEILSDGKWANELDGTIITKKGSNFVGIRKDVDVEQLYSYIERKKYSFTEAFKSYEEGREIECCFSGLKLKKQKGLDLYIRKCDKDWDVNPVNCPFTFDEIRVDWYINE